MLLFAPRNQLAVNETQRHSATKAVPKIRVFLPRMDLRRFAASRHINAARGLLVLEVKGGSIEQRDGDGCRTASAIRLLLVKMCSIAITK